MASRGDILLVTREPAVARTVGAALGSGGPFKMAGVHPDLTGAVLQLGQTPAAAVLVDIDPEPLLILENLAPAVARFPDTRFVVIAGEPRSDRMLEAMRVGARHFIVKSALAAELANVLQRLVPPESSSGPGQGTVVTLLSAGGGSGATTLALNLANEMALTRTKPSLLIDLDWYYGALGLYLGVVGNYGITDVLAREHIDGDLVRSTAVTYSPTLDVLLSPVTINFAKSAFVRSRRLAHLLDACQRAYACTVVDAPRVPVHVAATLAAASRAVLIVLQLTVKDIHVARSARAALLDRGVPPERIRAVVSRYARRSAITLDEAREALGDVAVTILSNDYRSVTQSINYGQPLSQVAPSSALRREVCQLAAELESRRDAVAVPGSK